MQSVEAAPQLWVDQRLSRLVLEGPQGPQVLRQPLPLTARLVRNGQVIADKDLHVRVNAAFPNAGDTVEEDMSRTENGAFTHTLVPTAAGIYTVTATARLGNQPLAVDRLPLIVSAYPAPGVARFQIEGAIAPGQSVILSARLNDSDRLERNQPVEVALFDQEDASLGTVPLYDDGRAPDQQAGDGTYSADLIVAPALRAIELAVAGRTVDGVSFSLRERLSLAQATAGTPTAAATTVTPMPPTATTPTAAQVTPTMAVTTVTPTPPASDKQGLAGSDWGWLAAVLVLKPFIACGGLFLVGDQTQGGEVEPGGAKFGR